MQCNYTLSTTLDLYFKQMGFVDVCVNRTGTSTRYYFNDGFGNTRELVINNNEYSIVDVSDVSFNGFVYNYTDYGNVVLIGIFSIVVIVFFEKLLSKIIRLRKRGKKE